MTDLRTSLTRRVYGLHQVVTSILHPQGDYIIAGGALIASPYNDIDLFHFSQKPDCALPSPVYSSPNAQSYLAPSGKTIQICTYKHSDLKTLVDSFDFAHIRIGALVTQSGGLREVYHSEGFLEARALNTTWYTGSNYPLSSLLRAYKYRERGLMTRAQYATCCLKILNDIRSRGIRDNADLKDQLDAIDLSLLPEDLEYEAVREFQKLFQIQETQ